ncbi:hypothetical protein LWI29_030016 [Acer saccharum]|uniref:Uncharacterized protein n=1 Tax=Acer saccharum TaxID=4024 RepID=A0AA39SBM6_ACESA|nr:hypothetical protein LWI29_030016 [Acer saccharum]
MNLHTHLQSSSEFEPSTVTQALKDLNWRRAMSEEYDALVHNAEGDEDEGQCDGRRRRRRPRRRKEKKAKAAATKGDEGEGRCGGRERREREAMVGLVMCEKKIS